MVHGDVPQCMDQCVSWVGEFLPLAYGSDGTANMIWTDLRRFATVPGVGSGYMQNTYFARA